MSGLRIKPTAEELREQDEEKAGRWLLTYCSLAITLVAIFMMLVSYSKVSGGKLKSYHRSIGFTGTATGEGVRGTDQTEQAVAALTNHTLMGGYSGTVQVTRIKGGFKVTVPGSMAFNTDSAVMQESVQPLLKAMAAIMKKGAFSVGIAAHTRDGSLAASQWELSGTRANTILRYFLREERIPQARLASAGFGSWHPVSAGTSGADMDKNDRVEFIFMLNDSLSG